MKTLCGRLDGQITQQVAHVHMEALENSHEQSKELDETGCTKMGGV